MFLVPESLHIYFLDSEKRVVDQITAYPWSLDPRTWRVYTASKAFRYALESSEPLEIEIGDELSFEV